MTGLRKTKLKWILTKEIPSKVALKYCEFKITITAKCRGIQTF